jgi:hypothetical protein
LSSKIYTNKDSYLIRPFCITILYHNLLLFIDIFHIKMCYLCYFVLFCMFDDYWRINCRSQISAGKSTVKALYFWSTKNISEKTDVPILSEDGLSQKGRLRWARRGPHHPWARGPP